MADILKASDFVAGREIVEFLASTLPGDRWMRHEWGGIRVEFNADDTKRIEDFESKAKEANLSISGGW